MTHKTYMCMHRHMRGDRSPSTLTHSLSITCRNGPPRSDRAGWLCVGFCCRVRDPGMPNNPVFLTVVFAKLWHALAGVYMRVFTFFFHVLHNPDLFCPAGSSS